jgi:hypothetical protein
MILEAVKCPDCQEIVSREIHINDSGRSYWVCPVCGTLHGDDSWYQYVCHDTAIRVIETRKPFGRFVEETGIEVIGIDNSDGNAWTEEFPDIIECLKWLAGEEA